MISHRFLFLLLLLLPIHNSVAQEETFEPLFENIDITKGLPHNTVQKIFQDSEGYMQLKMDYAGMMAIILLFTASH